MGDGALTLDDLHNPVGQEEIKIVPVIVGAGGNTGTILAGVALHHFCFQLALERLRFRGWSDWNGFSNNWRIKCRGFVLGAGASTAIGSIGLGLVLTGVAGMISPVPNPARPRHPSRSTQIVLFFGHPEHLAGWNASSNRLRQNFDRQCCYFCWH